jgi:GH25 family lysozyme M1 (1,4-beta-N-acetylmuramidase)
MIKNSFTNFEQQIIDAISAYGIGKIISIQDFLENIFFTKETGRSLIIQIKDQYAMFFLPIAVFDNSSKQAEELHRFVELFWVIDYLSTQGYISIFKEGHQLKQEIYYTGSEFNNPRVDNGKLILNLDGIYSVKPEEIKNKNGNVIYKGIEFKDNALILKNAIGKFYISDRITTLKADNSETLTSKEEQPKKRKWETLAFRVLSFLLLKIILIFIFFVKKDLNTLYESHGYAINNKIEILTNMVTSKIKHDSVFQKKMTAIKPLADQTVKANPAKIKKRYGIDISRWNGKLLNHKLPDSIHFVICKATEGITLVDNRFKRNWKKIKSLGLTRGAYHFYLANDDPIKQAEHFWKQIKDRDSSDIVPIIDIERGSIKYDQKIDAITLQSGVLTFLNHLERLSSTTPMVYVNLDFANQYITHQKFAKYPLWIADYTSNDTPEIPNIWKDVGYTIWQKSSSYKEDAIINDLDIYNTDLR